MTRRLENLGDGRRAKVFRVDLGISVERRKVRSIERFRRIDRGPEFQVGNYAVVTGSDTGCEHRAIDIRRAGIGSVIAFENDTGTHQGGKRGRISGCDQIRSHPVPHHHHDVGCFSAVVRSASS